MTFDLSKNKQEIKYYYSKDDSTIGPFNVAQLLKIIDGETMVYREGIEWSKAKDIVELKNYFKVDKIIEKQERLEQTYSSKITVEQKKRNNGGLLVFIMLLIVAGVGYYFYNQNIDVVTENIIPIDSVITKENTLSDFEIFDLVAIRNYNPSDEQKINAMHLIEEADIAMSSQNYTEAIAKYKEALKNVPQAQTYFLLSNAYFKNSDFIRSEQCIKLAGGMDYQPKSELDYKLILIHAIQGNYVQLTDEILNLSYYNPTILNNIEKDTAFYSFRFSPNYLEIIEKNAVYDLINEESIYNTVVVQYFEAMNNKIMDANDFFSENVNQWLTRENINPSEINEIINSNTEYVNSQLNLIGSGVIISAFNARQAWLNFTCYRSSKNQFQSCRIKVEFIFDDQNRISSYKELEVKDIKFFN